MRLQASTNSTVESIRSSATAAHIHLYIKNALSRLHRPHNIGITTLLFNYDRYVWVLLSPTIEGRVTGPTVYFPYPRRSEGLTICRC